MYSYTFEVTWARVIGPLPITASRSPDRVTGFCRALFLPAIIKVLSCWLCFKNSNLIVEILAIPIFDLMPFETGGEDGDGDDVILHHF